MEQDADNYYKIYNTDGYGPGHLIKVVGGQVVDSVSFQQGYTQNNNYHISISFSPGATRVEAFGQVLDINTDINSITVNRFRLEARQQDAYYDNLEYYTDYYSDDFGTDTRHRYTLASTSTFDGVGQFLYDSSGGRLRLLTGDDIGLEFSKALPPLESGVFSIDFLPLVKYPNGGEFFLTLEQDDDNYYYVFNSDGYGPGQLIKVVGGLVVDYVSFQQGFIQNNNYHISVSFSPGATRVEAFGQVLDINTDSSPITVNRFRLATKQEDAYYDNLEYYDDSSINHAPVADAGPDQTVDEGATVFLDGSASFDPDGTVIDDYFWEQTGGTSVALSDPYAMQPSFTASQGGSTFYTLTFRLTVTDDGGLTASDTVTIHVKPAGVTDYYFDDFGTDTRAQYTVTDTWTQGGMGQFLYDSVGGGLQLLTGDDIGLEFSKSLPPIESGVFSIDFLPLVKYPNGGNFYLTLAQDAENYYKIYNTDGYGPGHLIKVVGGQVVDSINFQQGYTQNNNYHISVSFSPGATRVEAFGQVLDINTDSSPITVNRFRLEARQQDAYYDNLEYYDDSSINHAPVADAGSDQTVNEEDLVALDGSASSDPDGPSDIAGYAWVQTGGPSVLLSDASAVQPTFTAPPSGGTSYTLTFQLTVTDLGGLTGSDTVTIHVDPVGVTTYYSDDFSTDTRAQYTVTDTWTQSGTGQFLYDSTGDRLRVLTGDNIGLEISKALPALTSGVFSIDFLPLVKYPNGGNFYLTLAQDAGNYYKITNSDGYGPGELVKVVGGFIVDSVSFGQGYTQNNNYNVSISFSPGATHVEAFGQVLDINTDSSPITVNRFRLEARQQDAYYDNLEYYDDSSINHAPVANAGPDQTVNEGDLVALDGSASTDPDGPSDIAGYAWVQTGGPSVLLSDASAVQPTFTAPPSGGTSYTLTFQLTVTDLGGLTGSDTVTIHVDPVGVTTYYSDDFSTDTRAQYTVTDTWTQSGTGQFLYDSTGDRLRVLTGDNIGLEISKALPALTSGVFSIDFLPLVKYPNGGNFYLTLAQDAGNYYKIYNTDGYGPGHLIKVVGGQVVDSVNFQQGYTQNNNYHISVSFSPGATRVEAFGQVLDINTDSSPITVNRFRLEARQQDAYYDNLEYYDDSSINHAPVADAGPDQTVDEGATVFLDGSASFDPDGTVIDDYFWEQTGGTSVALSDPYAMQPSFTASQGGSTFYTLTFRLTVTDDGGLTASDTVTIHVKPAGVTDYYFDDFGTDTRAQYTVTDTWTQGGMGQFLYDSVGGGLQLLTGDDIGLEFSKSLPPLESGVFSIDVFPTVKYPNGGNFYLTLEQDANNYYKIYNTDGYGPGHLIKVVGGQVVDSVNFQQGYTQNNNYHISVSFNPWATRVEAFGQVLDINTDSSPITVNCFRLEVRQQDAYYDNLMYYNSP